MGLGDARRALERREKADLALGQALRELQGADRKEALRLAVDTGVPARDLAHMLGVSRQRIYALIDD